MEREFDKPEWLTGTWWAETLGMYRDERIDAITRVAYRRGYVVLVLELLFAGIYLLWHTHWSALLVFTAVALSILFLWWRFRQFDADSQDEWTRYQTERLYLFPASGLMLFIISFWLLPTFTPIPNYIWGLLFSLPTFVIITSQFLGRAFPLRTVLMTILAGVGGGIFGWHAGAGTITQEVIYVVGVLLGLAAVIQSFYWWRARKW